MKHLSVDLESFSSAPLNKCGVYKYASSPDFEILLFGYSADGGPVRVVDFTAGEQLPAEVLSALTDPDVTKWAFNAQFERVCLSRWLGMPVGEYLEPDSWRCTMVWSATLGLPLSLEGVGAVLGLEKQKLKEGKDLIRYFCTPAKDRDGNPYRHYPEDAPEKWERFKAYNLRDVETEMSIQQKLFRFPVPEAIWDEYHLDQEINDRGIAVDMELVRQAIGMDARSKEKLTAQMRRLTDLENPNSVQQMKQWLADHGLEMDSLGKKEVAALLKTAPTPLSEVLLLRQQLAKSSVKKYTAMATAVCPDGRARGMFQFYGANRTGRWAGRIIQLQNLPQNHLSDLAEARSVVRSGDFEAVEMLYEDVPDTLSQLIRTAFVPQYGRKFIVSDFSAIEARVLAWFAGEQWRQEVFAQGGDIYCASASQMFHVPVEKHGRNAHLRQKGKQAELACIAEGQLVLTDKGLIPIESVTTDHRLWDGENWVNHEGVIYKGKRTVIDYDGLIATPDHLVWVEGQPQPIQFGVAATSGAHLVQTGNGRHPIRLGKNHLLRKAMEPEDESLLCLDAMHRLRSDSMAEPLKSTEGGLTRMPKLFSAKENSTLAGQAADCCKTEMRKPKRCRISQLWRAGYKILVSKCHGSRTLSTGNLWSARKRNGNRPNQQQPGLCSRKSALCDPRRQLQKQTVYSSQSLLSRILAVCKVCSNPQIVSGVDAGRDYSRCRNCGIREKKKLEAHSRTTRLYDIRNAGAYHRFTVSGKLVHNCGYGGSVGALKAMGALEMGVPEDELKPLVDAWRASNPRIVQFWWDVDREVKRCVKERCATETHGLRFAYQSGFLFITLPSGRRLAYVKPKIGENRFGGESVTYEGVGGTKKWERLESYGPKFVENCIAAGTLVVAQRGLVPIEEITDADILWDGCEWCHHDGLIAKGQQTVVKANGIYLTPEHQILTEKGWMECAKSSGFSWAAFSLPDGFISCGEHETGQSPMAVPVHLRGAKGHPSQESHIKKESRQVMRLYAGATDLRGSEATRHEPPSCVRSVALHEAEVPRPESSCVPQLRRPGDHSLQGMDRELRGVLAGYGTDLSARVGFGQDQQQRGLPAWKLPVDHSKDQHSEQADKSCDRYPIRQDDGIHAGGVVGHWRDNAHIPSGPRLADRISVHETGLQKSVYDIRNCGPRHRFAVWDGEAGKVRIVSNCVQATARDILMYAMQTLRCCSIVAHVHDELIIECDRRVSLAAVCEQMGRTPPWAKGLLLRADGYECDFYKKD